MKFGLKAVSFLLILSYACSSKSGVNTECVTLDFVKAVKDAQVLEMSNYFSSVEYIPLETNRESSLGSVRLFTGCNGNYYFVSSNNQILSFNHCGEFKGKVGEQGKGPNEYSKIIDIDSDKTTGNLSILTSERILVYDSNSNLMDNISLQKIKDVGMNYVYDFISEPDGYVVLTSKSDSITCNQTEYCVLFNGKGSVETICNVGELHRTPIIMMGQEGSVIINSKLYKRGGSTVNLIKGDFSKIYSIKEGEKSVVYNIDFGKYGDLRNNSNPREKLLISEAIGCDRFFLITFLFPNSQFPVICNGAEVLSGGVILYDCEESRLYAMKNIPEIRKVAFKNDLDEGMPFYPYLLTSDGKFVCIVDAINFMEYAKIYDNPKMKEIAGTLTEESNPVMVVATLK